MPLDEDETDGDDDDDDADISDEHEEGSGDENGEDILDNVEKSSKKMSESSKKCINYTKQNISQETTLDNECTSDSEHSESEEDSGCSSLYEDDEMEMEANKDEPNSADGNEEMGLFYLQLVLLMVS